MASAVSPAPAASAMDALDYEAPFLIEKLLKAHIAESAEEAEALFRVDETKIWEMNSLRVDEAWHQFILFTAQYADFCQRFFGRYIHHSPSNAPNVEDPKQRPVASFAMFAERYEELFGSPLPDIWYDERSVTVDRRVVNENSRLLTVRDEGEDVHLLAPGGDVLMTVNALAREALDFLARTGAFYVRELPGGLTDEEKVALVAMLVEHRIIRSAG
jgi:hypothetical protein